MTTSERKERASRFQYEIARVLRDESGLDLIKCEGKTYKLVKTPVLKTVDKNGICSIYGFVEVRK